MKRLILPALLGAFLGAVFAFPVEAFSAAREGLTVFALSVLPALLPALTALLLLSSRLSGRVFPVCAALLCGSPGGARLLSPWCNGKREALFCACVTGTMSPMFFLGALADWTGDVSFARALYGVHLAAAFLCGLPFRQRGMLKTPVDQAPLSIGEAALDASRAMLIACVCVTLGRVMGAMICVAFPRLSPSALAAISALLESAGGTKALCALPLSRGALSAAVSFFCAFGGLSIQMQNAAFLSKSGVKQGELCLIGLLRGGVAVLVSLLVFGMRP